LNIDLGELPDEPEELYACAHVASIACGGHAGDEASMRRALARCAAHGVSVGAHPSYPDRASFGRTAMTMAAARLRATVSAQCESLARLAREAGLRVTSVKAHGALYHAATTDETTARALVEGALAALGRDVTFFGPAAGALASVLASAGVTLAREGFADRGTRPDGTLIPRGEPGALVADPAAAADLARRLALSGRFDTLCVHGDTPGAIAVARAVRDALDGLVATERAGGKGAGGA
jgi:UPF0271 protein